MVKKFISRAKKYGMKYVLKIILQNKIYRPLDNWTMKIVGKVCKNIALKNVIIIESHNDFDANGGAFYRFLITHGYNQNYKIVWLLRNKKPGTLPKNVYGFQATKPSLRKAYYLSVAKYLSYDHALKEKVNAKQQMFYLTHGPVGLKAFKGKIILPETLDYCLTPSKELAPILANQYMLEYPTKKQIILGYPMHDAFYEKGKGDLNKITKDSYEKVILWMPTFRTAVGFHRQDSETELPLGIPIIRDMDAYIELNEKLRMKQTLLIIKIHPMQDMTTVKIKSLSNIIVLDGVSVKSLGVDNYRLMKDTDALISDYSSVAYDYLHMNKPIGYTLDDAAEYKLGFIVENPKDLMAGHIIYNQDDFLGFIDDVLRGVDPYESDRKGLFDYIFKYHDGNSSKRLADFMGLVAPNH